MCVEFVENVEVLKLVVKLINCVCLCIPGQSTETSGSHIKISY